MALLFPIIAWIVTAAGATLTRRLPGMAGAARLERGLISFAVGLGVLAYGMLTLGLLGGLYAPSAAAWLLILAALGGRSHVRMARALRERILRGAHLPAWGWGIALLFLAFALVAAVGVLTPPTPLEWDSLAYHLADPKIYIQSHRIYYLPWESHSNFAFTTEMWYTLGLLWGSVPLAKCFHFACGVGTCLTLYALGRRHLTPGIGLVAALLFASTPLVFWEGGTAYADLATTFFATLTLLTVVNAVSALSSPAVPEGYSNTGGRPAPRSPLRLPWLAVSAALMGLTLSTKATALTTLGLLALGLLVTLARRAGRNRAAVAAAAWVGLSLLVGAPWYVKSAVYTHGNPVFPFYYNLFGGQYWNAAAAAAYDQSNAAFGMGRAPISLLLLPWNLMMALLPGHSPPTMLPFNNFATPLMTLSPVLLAALFFPAFGRGTPGIVKILGAYALGAGLLWFVTAQHVRYLLPVLPVLCLLTAWVLSCALNARWWSGYALMALTSVSVLFSLWIGGQFAAQEAPVALGLVSTRDYMTRRDAVYPALEFVNTQLPPQAKLVFYGNPLGFYCDRPYLWGEAGHSAFIPYGSFRSAEDLRRWLAAQGVTHILVNTQYFGLAPSAGWPGWVYQLTAGSSAPLFSRSGVQVYALPVPK